MFNVFCASRWAKWGNMVNFSSEIRWAKVYKMRHESSMPYEALRSIYDRVNRLEAYIQAIPRKQGAVVLATKIGEACRLLPSGRHYDDVVKDLERLLPVTIDEKLREVEVYCRKLGAPYAPHIIAEVAGILAELQSFRSAHGWAPAAPVGQAGRMPATAEMRGLLGRLEALG